MKKLNKLQIPVEKLLKDEELKALSGGYGSYSCYQYGWMEGWCENFITYINTSSCSTALLICNDMGGGCVTGDGCY